MIRLYKKNSVCDLRHIAETKDPAAEIKGFNFAEGNIINLGKNNGWLFFDAQIFNLPAKYKSETEYLRDLFMTEGIHGAVREANSWDGAWAIVHVTPVGIVWAFTDPLGIKQLYFNEKGEICSTIIPLVENFNDLDLTYKSIVRKWGYNTDDRTPWNSVKRILPGHVYSMAGGKVLVKHFESYYDWGKDIPEESIYEVFAKAMNRRLTYFEKHDPSILLSGGLDSSIVTAMCKQLGYVPPLKTIANSGELEFAKAMAEHVGKSVDCLSYSTTDEDILEALRFNECPVDLGSMVPQNAMMKALSSGYVFTGDGADELFGGYRRSKTYDSQRSDIFEELTFYHLPRVTKMATTHGVMVVSPFVSQDLIKKALSIPYPDRIDKNVLKQEFGKLLPPCIVNRDKKPLKNPLLVEDPEGYRNRIFTLFYEHLVPELINKYN